MPLSPQDKAYWKDRLGWKAFAYLLASTLIMGCVVWPLVMYGMACYYGHARDWSWSDFSQLVQGDFMLAFLVATILWFIGQFYIWMDWLPARR